MKPTHVKQFVDAISKQYSVFGDYQNDGSVTYFFDKSKTEQNQHNKLSGKLLKMGVECLIEIKIGRGKYTKGNQYATVRVPLQNIDINGAINKAFVERYGIKATCFINTFGLLISGVKDRHSAATLLKEFRHYKVEVVAESYNDFAVFVPMPAVQTQALLEGGLV